MKGGIDSSEIELLQMDQDDSEIDGNPFLEGENVDPLCSMFNC